MDSYGVMEDYRSHCAVDGYSAEDASDYLNCG